MLYSPRRSQDLVCRVTFITLKVRLRVCHTMRVYVKEKTYIGINVALHAILAGAEDYSICGFS